MSSSTGGTIRSNGMAAATRSESGVSCLYLFEIEPDWGDISS
jgi:hypothetical protein